MAKATYELIKAFRETASRLRNGAAYSWGHHGACNCGNLLQVLTPLSEKEILTFAHTGTGEWTELAQEYCPTSGAPVDLLISRLEQAGLTHRYPSYRIFIRPGRAGTFARRIPLAEAECSGGCDPLF